MAIRSVGWLNVLMDAKYISSSLCTTPRDRDSGSSEAMAELLHQTMTGTSFDLMITEARHT
jgi:hypothetical protein